MTASTRKLRAALEVLNILCEVDEKLPIRVARAFLITSIRCVIDGSVTIDDVAEATKSSPAAVGRDLKALGPWKRKRELDGSRDPGYKLLKESGDVADLRRTVYTLTPAGASLIDKLLEAV